MVEEAVDVMVVGAGPGGLASAITLGSYGAKTLVVERRPTASSLPRATLVSTSTMELLRRFGLEERTWKRSIEVEWRAWACTTLAAADDGEPVEVGVPTREQALLVSPTSPACLAQDELEPLLEEHAASLASVRLERGVEVVALERGDDNGYVVSLASGRGLRRVHARYVIGADGLRSTIRDALGITFEGETRLAERLVAVFRAPLWNLVGEHRYGIYFLREGHSFLPAGKPDRWVFGMDRDNAVADVEAPTHEDVTRWIRESAGDPRLPIEIERVSPVTFGIGLADRFREGDAFLIGDAAHRVTPRGGTGLNTAIRDGFDIGWKLAWVLRGWACEPLLESYERERRSVAEFNTQRSSRSDGSILGTAIGLNADIGGRINHVWLPLERGRVSSLDVLGDGLTLFVGPGWEGAASRPDGSPPLAIERLDALAARGLGLATRGSLLARPDGSAVELWNNEVPSRARLWRAIAAATGAADRAARSGRPAERAA
jgi:2-polyprenyl-6-methoxyphenol hydroxylase-like FAD-dependent oxidoreductase